MFQELRVWAYPESPGPVCAQLVLSITENPQPVIIFLQAIGATPHLRLDKDLVQFDRVIINKLAALNSLWFCFFDEVQMVNVN